MSYILYDGEEPEVPDQNDSVLSDVEIDELLHTLSERAQVGHAVDMGLPLNTDALDDLRKIVLDWCVKYQNNILNAFST